MEELINDYGQEKIKEILDIDYNNRQLLNFLIGKLELVHIGINMPRSFDPLFGVLDFSVRIGEDFYDELLVAKSDVNGNYLYLTIES